MTMCDVRRCYWIPRLRSLAKKVFHECNACKRYSEKPISPPGKSVSPAFRTELSDPFIIIIGVDFAGPIIYKVKKGTFGKSYVAFYTCASTRAVQLKLCKDLTAPEFKRSLKEFVARRGLPKSIVSDNGKTFVATSRWLKTLQRNEDLMNCLVSHRIQWKFNLSRAAWWGGFFERLIGIMKRSMSEVVGKRMFTFPKLEEVLLDVECTMNNRSLSYQGEEYEDQVITPNVLMKGRSKVVLEEDLEKLTLDNQMTKRMAFLKNSKEQLRERWVGEYFHALEERQR